MGTAPNPKAMSHDEIDSPAFSRGFQRILAVYPSARSSTSSSISSVRCLFHTWKSVYRGLVRILRTALYDPAGQVICVE